jgi:ribonuclease R
MGRKNTKKTRNKLAKPAPVSQLLRGVLELTRSGMGYVSVDNQDVDIMVRPADLNSALHGDMVRVAIKERRAMGKRMQGVVKEVLKRKRSEFIGLIEMGKGFAFCG